MAGSRAGALKAWRTMRNKNWKKPKTDWRAAGLKAWKTRRANESKTPTFNRVKAKRLLAQLTKLIG